MEIEGTIVPRCTLGSGKDHENVLRGRRATEVLFQKRRAVPSSDLILD